MKFPSVDAAMTLADLMVRALSSRRAAWRAQRHTIGPGTKSRMRGYGKYHKPGTLQHIRAIKGVGRPVVSFVGHERAELAHRLEEHELRMLRRGAA